MALITPVDRVFPPVARPLKVLMAGLEWFTDNPGGGGRYLTDAATGLAVRGHTVHVLVPRLAPAHPATETIAGVHLHRFEAAGTPGKLLGAGRAAAALQAAFGPFDVVHSHFALFGAGPLWHPALRSARRVTQFQGPWAAESAVEGEGALAVAAKRAIERAAYARSDAFVVLSEAFQAILVEGYGVAPERVRVIPAGIDLARFHPAADREAVRRSLGMGRGPVLFAMRRLVRRMGLEVLLDAFATIRRAHPEATLRIAGTGPLENELRARAEALGLGPSVTWLGRVSDADLVAHYQAADLTVVPTVALEGFGLITVESLACGTPVVGTSEGGTAEILRPFSPALVVPPGDADALAEAIAGALTGERPDAAACRAYAEGRYGWPVVLDQLEAVLSGVRR